MEFTIYTDGGCRGNRRNSGCIGGYGFLILDPAKNIIWNGGGKVKDTTNNMMEMRAVIEGMRWLKTKLNESYGGCEKHDCIVLTDSKYVCENYEDYLPEWKKRGWKKSNRKPVINKDLWICMDDLTPEFKSFRFKWVKAHATDKYNIHVDAIVQRYMRDGSIPTPIT